MVTSRSTGAVEGMLKEAVDQTKPLCYATHSTSLSESLEIPFSIEGDAETATGVRMAIDRMENL